MEESRRRLFSVGLVVLLSFMILSLETPVAHAKSTTIVIDDLHSSTVTRGLQGYLVSRGYNVVMASSTPQQAGSNVTRILESLESTRAALMIVVFYQPGSVLTTYSNQEASQLRGWVSSGGNIIVIVAPSSGTCYYDIGQPGTTTLSVANSITRSVGIEVGSSFAIDSNVNTNLTVSSSNPIFNKVNSLFFFSSDHFSPGACDSYAGGAVTLTLSSGASNLLNVGSNSIFGIALIGSGEFLVAGFSIGGYSVSLGGADTGGIIWSGQDNDIFIANLFTYLAPIGSTSPPISQSTSSLTNSTNPANSSGSFAVSLDTIVLAAAIVIAGVAFGIGLSRRKSRDETSKPSG